MTQVRVTDAHTGWACTEGASLITEANTPGKGHLPNIHAVIYACGNHQTDAEGVFTAAGYATQTYPAPPGHKWNPWECGHITAYDADKPAESFASTAAR